MVFTSEHIAIWVPSNTLYIHAENIKTNKNESVEAKTFNEKEKYHS